MHSTSTAGRSSMSAALVVAALFLAALTSANTITCDTSLGEGYPYCVSVPDGAGDKKLPTVLFLSGRGARGPPSNVKSLASYDGFGKLVSEYAWGNKDEAHTLAATKFIVITPIAPESFRSGLDPQWWYPELLDKVVAAVSAKYPVDMDQFHCSGYSMGGMGTWRYAVHSGKCVTLNPNGAYAETNSIKNSLGQQVPPPADQLNNIAQSKIPVRAFSGAYDTTIKPELGQQTQAKMQSLGDGNSQLTILNTDHSGLTTQPFTAQLLNWMLSVTNTNPGASTSNNDNSADSSASSTLSSASSTPTVSSDDNSNTYSSSSSSTSTTSSIPSTTSTGTKKTCKRRKRSVKRPSSSSSSSIPANASDLMRSLLARREAEGLGKRHVLGVQKRGSRLRH